MKQLKWKQKLRADYLFEKAGIKSTDQVSTQEEEDILNWCKNIDYFQYENEWKNIGTNTQSIFKEANLREELTNSLAQINQSGLEDTSDSEFSDELLYPPK